MSNKNYFVHKTSFVDQNVIIGDDTKIWHFSHIQNGAKIGSNCTFGQNVNVGINVIIGNFCKVQNNVSIYKGVELEDFIFCGPSMVFTNIERPRSEFPQNKSEDYEKTLIGKSVTIGANATIICGITIGKYAFIGAGSVITKDIPDFALVVGNPGVVVGWVNRYGDKLSFDENGVSICPNSNEKYHLLNNQVKLVDE